jgi:hypothetical protein
VQWSVHKEKKEKKKEKEIEFSIRSKLVTEGGRFPLYNLFAAAIIEKHAKRKG